VRMMLAVKYVKAINVMMMKETVSSVGASPPTERQHALTRRPHRTTQILMLK
jgi:hypothetical protein